MNMANYDLQGSPHGKPAGKKIGLACSYIPEELILAAGMEPVHIRGLADTVNTSHSYTCTNMCSYVENILESGLTHQYDDLSGIIFADSCDCMRRLYDLFSHYVKAPFSCMLEIPKNSNQSAISYFAGRLLDLKEVLESGFDVTISESDLTDAIGFMNSRRKLMNDIIEGQKETPPRHTGTELLSALLSETTRPKRSADADLKKLAAKPIIPPSDEPEKPRLMVVGNRIDRNPLFEMVENAGGAIVVPDSCCGLKHYSRRVDASLPPYEAIARGYLTGPSCARMPGFEDRLERIKNLARDYRVCGIIYNRLKFCDYGMFETPQLERFLREAGIPLLILETDYTWQDTGRIRTRIEAFMEMLETKP
jgi:benzoyl-CoA reductase/2-hydroxyglutaryl-CoA dehydratase subunit BcrC/BadD/HgdB